MIKVIIERKIAQSMESTYDAAIKDTLRAILEAPGYMSGANFKDASDENHRVIITNWRSLSAWKQWQGSEERRKVIAVIQPILVTPEKITVLTA
ncbi:MAG: heme-degrading monooxygenase HmoA [Oleispira sp.]|jgi:heme-degrading monooxygenase HmoA